MSKTLGTILSVGAAVAVNVIPGVGQALSAAIVGSITAAGVVTAVGISTALSAAGSALNGSPASRADTTESARKSPLAVRTRAYGKMRRCAGGYIR